MAPKRLPDKLYYRIGEISQHTGLEPYVLRFWESEFEQLAPQKSGSRQRLYRREDVATILLIKRLLYEEGYTIDGAKKFLSRRRGHAASGEVLPDSLKDELRALRRELETIVEILKES